MSSFTTISLVRHGHIRNPDNVFHGRLPGFPLSEQGELEVRAAASVLAEMRAEPVAAIYTSPMLRTRQTATILQEALAQRPQIYVDEQLNEVYTPFDGSPREEMAARDWDFYTGVDSTYEQPGMILQRMLSFIQRTRRLYTGRHVVGVTHADPLAFLWLWVLEEEVNVENRKRLDEFGADFTYPHTASITTLRFRSIAPEEQPRYSYQWPYQAYKE